MWFESLVPGCSARASILSRLKDWFAVKPFSSSLHGFLNLAKPPGWTSREVVDFVVRLFPRRSAPKVGHAGTLDPLATGVLVVAVGEATKLIDRVQAQTKVYTATIRLGAESDTLDAAGVVVERDPAGLVPPSVEQIENALQEQVGIIQQVPPAHSALKVGGRRAYELARAGETVELAARPVRIDAIRLTGYQWPRVEIEIECGAGTYIRSIARDLGQTLGTGGIIEVLTRTRIGQFRLEEAHAPGDLSLNRLEEVLIAPLEAMIGRPRVRLTEEQMDAILQGKRLDASVVAWASPPAINDQGEVALVAPESRGGHLVALAEPLGHSGIVWLQPRRVLATNANPTDFRGVQGM